MREQKETGLKREFPKDLRPVVKGSKWSLGYDPKLAVGMVDDDHGFALSWCDGPTAAQKVHLLIGIDPSA